MRALLFAAIAATAVAAGSGQAFASPPPTLVVDDDGVQCGQAGFTSIQAAVDAAQSGYVIRVCPGRYAESVTVDKSLTLKGDPDAVEAVDCFDPTGSQPDDLDPAQHVIVDGTGSADQELIRLRADGIEVEGFVLQGASSVPLPADTRLFRRAIDASDAHSGYRVHHNLIRLNTVGALFNSSGVLPSSFDHNCLRENDWGLANRFLPLVDARIHHNSTFRTSTFAYEQTRNCPEFHETGTILTCSGSPIGMERVVFDHNVSVNDTSTGNSSVYRLAFSSSTTVFENTVTRARAGVRLVGANEHLQIVGNHLDVGLAGIPQQSTPPVPSNSHVLIRGNTITGAATAAGIGMGIGALTGGSEISDNVIRGLQGEGIALTAGNTDTLVRGNIVENNGRDGIRAGRGATGNTFEANVMHGNGSAITGGVDARDENEVPNEWHGNLCETDFPTGTICGVP